MNNWREEQVYICFDGPEGLVIQTTMGSYQDYYRLLGWELLGQAGRLPGFEKKTLEPVAVKRLL